MEGFLRAQNSVMFLPRHCFCGYIFGAVCRGVFAVDNLVTGLCGGLGASKDSQTLVNRTNRVVPAFETQRQAHLNGC